MKKISNFEEYILSTGRVIKTCGGVIGIDDSLVICGGYDSVIYTENYVKDNGISIDSADVLNNSECVEVADYMIGLWTKFKEENME